MANGQPGKKTPDATRNRAIQLLNQSLTVDQVAARLSISKSLVRNIQKADKAEKDRKPNG
jgi:DNA invertase Pin-like site-specific DNA recombinase